VANDFFQIASIRDVCESTYGSFKTQLDSLPSYFYRVNPLTTNLLHEKRADSVIFTEDFFDEQTRVGWKMRSETKPNSHFVQGIDIIDNNQPRETSVL
jgi:hypothetical protein